MAQPKLVSAAEFKIDKGLPMPESRRGAPKYPWRQMVVGDSFFIPGTGGGGSHVAGAAKRTGWKFAQRAVTEGGVKGVRVWRIK